MRVLVTGASGFIGGALANRLVALGNDVRFLARTPENLPPHLAAAGDVVEGDITDEAAVRRATKNIDVVYSLAGTFREPNLSDQRYREVNVDAVGYFLMASSNNGVKRLVHCSTCGIHGSIVGDPANEQYPITPVGIYEETKAAGDKLALDYAQKDRLEVVVIRPTPVYGQGDTRLLKLFKLANKKTTVLLGSGTAGYHLVYIDDLVDAFVLGGTVPDISGEAFLIGGGEIPSINDLMARVAEVLGNTDQTIVHLPAGPVRAAGWACEVVCRPFGLDPPIYRRRVDFFTNNRAYNIEKARTMLGYSPKVNLTEGLRRTAEWYREQQLL